MFQLPLQLTRDSHPISELKFSTLLLKNNSLFPWLVLVPRKLAIELIDLSFEEQQQLLKEINIASQLLKKVFNPDKINIAMLGNVVPQLHVHVIARFRDDVAFPKPVWNVEKEVGYAEAELASVIAKLKKEIYA